MVKNLPRSCETEDDATIDETTVGVAYHAAVSFGESERGRIDLRSIRYNPAVLTDSSKGGCVSAYFAITIGACLFAATLLALDSFARRKDRRNSRHDHRT
jgi:hypothetical protein